MSLNKIAVSRQQRGGLNLHKSLLVSHVLMQAKNVYIMENYQAVMQARTAAMDNNNVHETETDTSEWNNNSEQSEYDNGDNGASSDCCMSESDNASHPVQSDIPAQDEDNKENSDCMQPSRVSENVSNQSQEEREDKNVQESPRDNVSGSQCNQCTKRRLEDITNSYTQNQSDYDSESACSDAKRMRLEDSSNCAPVNSRPDCKQISSLVNRFSVGFSGLLETDRHQTGEEAKNRDGSYAGENSCQTVQGPSVESPISCSSQIASFSPITPQAIVLTV
eukprot:GHVU01075505.1.p1 GENE.GHVU01075505.1~~GHVU01075505.1.p1  ORF type:complete len:286 (+),score=28.95 GHVU01075505.1:25-858(+)